MVQEMIEQVQVIRKKMKAAQDRHKSYVDLRRSEIEFNAVDKVLLKVSPMKGVIRFGERGKLSQKYLRKYVSDQSYVLEIENELDDQLTYEEVPTEILDTKVRKARNDEVSLVKVLWSNHEVEEATWKT
ncbi:uncharacterized protein LOC141601851 [Silene latifolia]|uniref:uncharacterized protein LOC141601851 n=1 Tax=Silene latifolia TaxID=37657 RepID=UPI003D7781DA